MLVLGRNALLSILYKVEAEISSVSKVLAGVPLDCYNRLKELMYYGVGAEAGTVSEGIAQVVDDKGNPALHAVSLHFVSCLYLFISVASCRRKSWPTERAKRL